MNTIYLILAGLGISAGLLAAIWSSRAAILRWHARQVDWWRNSAELLSPGEERRAEIWTLASYASAAALPVAILAAAPRPWFALAGPPVAWAARGALVRWLRLRRRARIEAQLPEAIRAVGAAISAGCTPGRAIEEAAAKASEPLRTELRLLHARCRGGNSIEDAARIVQQRLRLKDFDLFVAALSISVEMGGPTGKTLERTAAALEAVQLMRGKIRAATAPGRTNILVLCAVPPVFLAADFLIDPEAVSLMLTTVPGWAVLAVAAGVYAAAISWTRRIIRADI